MTRPLAVSSLLLFIGATLVLADLPWFRQRALTDRLRPYLPSAVQPAPTSWLSASTLAELLASIGERLGVWLSRINGFSDPLAIRLARVGSPLPSPSFRVRQLASALLGASCGALVAIAIGMPSIAGLTITFGGSAAGFVAPEQRLNRAARARQTEVFRELPVVSEQLAMLLAAGFSLVGALSRIAQRGSGACARDIDGVCRRIRQGLTESQALREWADVVDVDALHRLVRLLAHNRETSDLGRLIAEEARAIRREAHRNLIELIERRSQQVWVPVTVATLLPGVIFLAIPFISALSLFGAT
jgi:tight adherence protein C